MTDFESISDLYSVPVQILALVLMPDSNSSMAGHCGGLVGQGGFNCIFPPGPEITAFQAWGPVLWHYENSWGTFQPTFYEFGYEFMLTVWAAAKIKIILIKLRVLPDPNLLECTRQRVTT